MKSWTLDLKDTINAVLWKVSFITLAQMNCFQSQVMMIPSLSSQVIGFQSYV